MQIRNTQQKKLIFSLMNGNKTHPTADEIYMLARNSDPHISRGTVYRNLNVLSENGDIAKITVPDGPDHFDSCTEPHYHFFCRKCGKLFDVPVEYQPSFDRIPEEMKMLGFTVEYHMLFLAGSCPACSEKNAAE